MRLKPEVIETLKAQLDVASGKALDGASELAASMIECLASTIDPAEVAAIAAQAGCTEVRVVQEHLRMFANVLRTVPK